MNVNNFMDQTIISLPAEVHSTNRMGISYLNVMSVSLTFLNSCLAISESFLKIKSNCFLDTLIL